MKWINKRILTLAALPIFAMISAGYTYQVSAINVLDKACNGNNVQGGNKKGSPVCTSNNSAQADDKTNNVVLRTISAAANIIALIAGVAAVIVIIIAGISYATAGGNSEQTKSARNRIIYAAVGLVIIASAWAIVRFVTDRVLT